jgi:imidazolonepropionase-like amidohydrolase
MVRSIVMKYIFGIIIDGTGADPIRDGVLLINGDRIQAVGSLGDFKIPSEAEVLNTAGGIILPGIINSHVHTAGDPGVRRRFLTSGVTSVCDLGSPLDSMGKFYKNQDDLGQPIARGFKSGPILTSQGGLPGALFQPDLNYEINTDEEARAAVSDLCSRGAEGIKVYLDPWFEGEFPILSLELVTAVVEEAHKLDLLVRAHVNRIDMLETALDAGVDVLEHVPLPQPRSRDRRRNLRDDDLEGYSQFLEQQYRPLETLILKMAAVGVVLVPTLSKLETSLRGSPFPKSIQPEIFERALDTVRCFHDSGGDVALGTDTITQWGDEAGMPLREMELLLETGLTGMDVIEAATRRAAIVSGCGEMVGTLEPGKLADLIIIEGDPLLNLNAFREISWVILNGDVVFPPA